jgi:integrase
MSGARRGELLGLRWTDIDTAAGTLTIRRSRTKVAGEVLESDPKTERSRRTIALDAGTMHVLERQKRLQEQEQALLGTRRVEQGYVFAAENGEPFDPDQVTRLFAAAVRRSGLPVIRLHDLRHVHATIMLTEQRQALTQVSRRLGHSTTITTANVYAHALAELDRKLADDFGASVLPEQPPESGQ